jgi:Trypsin-like peptidase domain
MSPRKNCNLRKELVMFASLKTILRRVMVSLALLLYVSNAGLPAFAAPETPEEARQHHEQAKTRSYSLSVVELVLKVDQQVFRGTGVVIVRPNQTVWLVSAIHVLAPGLVRPSQLSLRPFNADPDNPAEWMDMRNFYGGEMFCNEEHDFIALRLVAPIPGTRPAQVAEHAPSAGDQVIAFGFWAADGRQIRGSVVDGDAEEGKFTAVRLGADHGDSGGPIFDTATGKVIGLVSRAADPKSARKGADTLAVKMP